MAEGRQSGGLWRPCFDDPALSPGAAHVLQVLWLRWGTNGVPVCEVYPSLETIGQSVRRKPRQVRNLIRELESVGYVRVVRRRFQSSNVYEISDHRREVTGNRLPDSNRQNPANAATHCRSVTGKIQHSNRQKVTEYPAKSNTVTGNPLPPNPYEPVLTLSEPLTGNRLPVRESKESKIKQAVDLITGPGGWNELHPDKQIPMPSTSSREVSEIHRRLAEGISPDAIRQAFAGIAKSDWHRERGLVTPYHAAKTSSAVHKHAQAANQPTLPGPGRRML